jgi:DNA-directed RNA polymerase subunit alpha
MLETNVTLPSKPRAISEEGFHGIYEIDGLYPGYGHTLGNSLRRIILSSLPGAAVTEVKIDGVDHEFSTIDGIKEDVITILLNLKRVRFQSHTDEPIKVTLKKSGTGIVTAADIDTPTQVEVLNSEQPICEITDKGTTLDMELTIERGMGYVPREVHKREKMEVGAIALDAVFTPIRRANYEVENMRVGDRTDYNRLRLIIETDGTCTPRESVEQAIEIMIHQLKAIIGFQESEPSLEAAVETQESTETDTSSQSEVDTELLKTRIETLDLSSRTLQALEAASVRTLGGLVRKKKDDILALEGIGPKGVEEISELLEKMNLSLNE